MTRPASSVLAATREAIARHKLGTVDPDIVSPRRAAALHNRSLLTPAQMSALAMSWLTRGLDRDSVEIAAFALGAPDNVSEAEQAFDRALIELGEVDPYPDDAVLATLELYLRAIIEHRLPPMVGMAALNELYDDRGDALLHHPARKPGDSDYLGQELGLEFLYTWYREFQDAADDTTWYHNDLPLDEQLAKFDEEVIAEARILHRHLCEQHPKLC